MRAPPISVGRMAMAAAIGLCWAGARVEAQQNVDIREKLRDVAQGLSQRNWREAMMPFDKSFAKYGELRDYFQGLTAGGTQVINELDETYERIENGRATLTVHWTMTMVDSASNLTVYRDEDLTIELVERKKNKWRITGLTPVKFFDLNTRRSIE